jgi:hypothetical protein
MNVGDPHRNAGADNGGCRHLEGAKERREENG